MLDASSPTIKRTLRLSIIEGAATQIFLNWTTGSVLIGYMLLFNATPTELGLVASVPLLAQFMSPLAAYLAERTGSRKLLTIVLAFIGRSVWVIAALIPQLGVPESLRASFIVGLVMISSIFQAAAGTLWAAWMGDVVPEKSRGRYFGKRTGIVGIIGMLANLGAGYFLDVVDAPLSFQVVLAVSVVSALVGIAMYLGHYHPPKPSGRLSLKATFQEPFREVNFRHFMLFAIYWQFAVLTAAPFVFPYFIEQLRMSFTQIAIWSIIASSSALVTTTLWGRVADRYGNKAVLAIGTFVAGVGLPGNWILAGLTGNLGFIWFSAVCDAIAWGAIGPAIFNLALASAPQQGRVAFIAMYSLVSGVAGFVGGLLSGPLLTLFGNFEVITPELSWTRYHWLFVLSGVLRANAWIVLRRVKETNAWRTRDVLRALRFGTRSIGFPWR
jgi:MFS family permease